MKILHWDEMFHPNFGYQINVLTKFQAMQGHEVIIMSADNIDHHPKFSSFGFNDDVAKADREFSEKYGIKIIRVPWYRVVSGRTIYKRGYIKKIIDVDADVIMCHTNDTLSAMTIALSHKKINKPIVFDNHMLEMASNNPLRNVFRLFFQKVITPIIIKEDWTVIRTQDDNYVNKYLGIPESQTPFISFGSDTTLFYPSIEEKNKFRKENNIKEDDFVVVYTGKLDEPKDGVLLATTLKEKFKTKKNVVAVIVGNAEGDYGQKVEEIFNESENRIIRFNTQKYPDLPQFYQAADLCVFSRQSSLSFYDAQACGLPVLSEDNHINVKRCSHNNGFTFKAGSVDSFREGIIKCVNMDENSYAEISENAYNFVKDKYNYKTIAKQYTDIMVKEFKKFHSK